MPESIDKLLIEQEAGVGLERERNGQFSGVTLVHRDFSQSLLKSFEELGSITQVEIYESRMTDDELQQLCSRVPDLQTLMLASCECIADASVALFLAMPHLEKLNIMVTGLTEIGNNRLRQSNKFSRGLNL